MTKEAVTFSSQQVLGSKKFTHKVWLAVGALEKINERKNRKVALNNSSTRPEKIRAHAAYT